MLKGTSVKFFNVRSNLNHITHQTKPIKSNNIGLSKTLFHGTAKNFQADTNNIGKIIEECKHDIRNGGTKLSVASLIQNKELTDEHIDSLRLIAIEERKPDVQEFLQNLKDNKAKFVAPTMVGC